MPLIQITLKSARINLGLTLKESAKLLDIHFTTLGKYENDSTDVPRSFILKIEKVYGIPSEFIFFGKQVDFINGKRNELNIVEQLA
jgi:transcriptional regulator with XRE-family HTH domain